jgi:hypothetical protein
MKRILLLKEHHGKIALDISTPEQLIKAALSVVKGRFCGQHDYYNPYMEEPGLPIPPEISKEQYNAMPEGELKAAAKVIFERHERKMQHYDEEIKEINLIKRCLETNDGRLAWKILQRRKCNEYEGYEIIEVKDEYNT